jgi:hypothetical protein
MGFRKPFRAEPVKLGAYQRSKQKVAARNAALGYLGKAILLGALVGMGSVALTGNGAARLSEAIKPIGVWTGMVRARPPQPGDSWRGCDEARASGTAPIYNGEPGYREGMDGDSDGIACEPYRGV